MMCAQVKLNLDDTAKERYRQVRIRPVSFTTHIYSLIKDALCEVVGADL